MSEQKKRPLVYSCSGCSSAAQMANWLAIQLDRLGLAEMSCIAGVGGDVPSLVRTAKAGREILVLDGCPLTCSLHCLDRHGVKPASHIILSTLDVPKRIHQDFDLQMAQKILDKIIEDLKKADTYDPASGE